MGALIFPLAGFASYLGYGWAGPPQQRRLRSMALGLTAFGLALGREPFVVFLALFMLPTFLYAAGRGWDRGAFPLYAASDLLLALALTARHGADGSWSLPAAGDWTQGAVIVALSALLRLAGSGVSANGPTLMGWWQGLFLAWWVGPSAAGGLGVGAALLLLAGVRRFADDAAAGVYLIAGATAALVAAIGGSPLAMAAPAVAATAFVLGERVISILTISLLPLSAVALTLVPTVDDLWIPGVALIAPVGLATIGPLLSRWPPARGGRGLAGLAGVLSFAVLSASVGFVQAFFWVVFVAGGAAIFATSYRAPGIESAISPPSIQHAIQPWSPGTLIGAIAFALALALEARLLVVGLATSFL